MNSGFGQKQFGLYVFDSAVCNTTQRPDKAEPYRQQILELIDSCQGNLVRVHEELVAGGAELSYAALYNHLPARSSVMVNEQE